MITFFNIIWSWILSIPTKVQAAFDYLIIEFKILFYDLLTELINFASDTMTAFFGTTQFTQQFESNYIGLSLDTRYAIETLNIPEALLIIISAYVLRFVIKLIPGV